MRTPDLPSPRHPAAAAAAAAGRPHPTLAPLARTIAAAVAPAASRDAARAASGEGPVLRTLGSLAAVATLYLARDVLVLVALGAFVAFLLAPVARLLEGARLPRGIAATLSVLALAGGMTGVLWVAAAQGIDLARRLPEYRQTIASKLEQLRSGAVALPIFEASSRLKELQGELGSPAPHAHEPSAMAAPPPARTRDDAVTVRVVQDASTPIELLGVVAGSVLGPLATAGVVLLLAIFLLSYRTDVRERLLRLGPLHRLGVTAQALEEVGRLMARYLIANLTVNVIYGAAVGLAIHLVGVPSAWLWGLLCALLRFVPYVGTWMGAALPVAVSIAVFDGWSRTLLVLASVLGCDLLVSYLLEPIAYGRRTGLSPLAVVLATVFWTWLWGVPGVLLAVPLTLCLAVVGRFVPGFGLFHVLLGDQPVLDAAERAYDRFVALDAAGAARVTAEATERSGPAAAHDDILLSALRRAESDRRAGVLDEERYRGICDAVRAVLDDADVPEAAPRGEGRVLCLPAFSEADRVAAEILAKHLASRGVEADVANGSMPPLEAAGRAAADGVGTLCVVSLPPFAALRARLLLRRARAQATGRRAVVLVLDPAAERGRVAGAFRHAGADVTAFALVEALAVLAPPREAFLARASPARVPTTASAASGPSPGDGGRS